MIAHNIRSTHNVGAIFRTAEGFGVEKVILSGYTPYPNLELSHSSLQHDRRLPHESAKITQQIHKTALGAEAMVDFEYYADITDWLELNVNELHLDLVALEQSPRSVNIGKFQPPEHMALLLGEEVHGIEPWLLDRCDHIIEIPMRGHKKSFNVSVAAGIAMYALTI